MKKVSICFVTCSAAFWLWGPWLSAQDAALVQAARKEG